MKLAVYRRRSTDIGGLVSIESVVIPPLREGEALVRLLAAPINPADRLAIMGIYADLPPLPACPGDEGVGEVVELGGDTDAPEVGSWVLLPPGAGSWSTHTVVPVDDLVEVPNSLEPLELSVVRVAVCTAYKLIERALHLGVGDAVILNAGNSTVSMLFTQMARDHEFKVVSIVRSDEAAAMARRAGADHCFVAAAGEHEIDLTG